MLVYRFLQADAEMGGIVRNCFYSGAGEATRIRTVSLAVSSANGR